MIIVYFILESPVYAIYVPSALEDLYFWRNYCHFLLEIQIILDHYAKLSIFLDKIKFL